MKIKRYRRIWKSAIAHLRGCLKSVSLVTLGTFRSPLTPLKKGGTGIKVPIYPQWQYRNIELVRIDERTGNLYLLAGELDFEIKPAGGYAR